jgi:hypothetical protein
MPIDMDERMFFVIGAPRSGTTLLMRMLNVHPDIYTRPEPHLLTPLAHLGYYGYVDKAPYDQYQAHLSVREYVADLPGKEQDYLDALRGYCDVLYGRMLEPTGKRFFLDKTPAYALILPFVSKIYPKGRYVVLTRHPFAIFASFAESFFDSDWDAAFAHNPIIARYVPAIASFLRDNPALACHVRYEDLVSDPEAQMKSLCDYAGMTFDPAMIDYGSKKVEGKGLGDPIGVSKDSRPNTKSLDKWAAEVAGNERRMEILREQLANVTDEDLAIWGFTRESLWKPVENVKPETALKVQSKARKWDRYHLQRRVLVRLRKNIRTNALGRVLGRMRFTIDVLLRE